MLTAVRTLFRVNFFSAWLGNFFEHYETALFGFLSPFLAPLFFPQQDPLTALILTYAMIPIGMLARPLGAFFFGYIGDVYGRKEALFFSLVGMAILSGCIALCPTYAQIGIWAPALFCIGRILQNFLAAGEMMGGAIYILENAPEEQHDLLGSLYASSTIGGMLMASLGVSIISYFDYAETAWRILYLFGCFTALFGALLRSYQKDSPPSPISRSPFAQSALNLIKSVRQWHRAFFAIMISAGFSYGTYSIALLLLNGWLPIISPVTKVQMAGLNTALLAFDFCILPLFGWISSQMNREKLMFRAALCTSVSAIPLFILLPSVSFGYIVAIRLYFVILGVAFCAPFHAWSQQLIPAASRYTIISLGYSLGTQLLGGPTAAISLWIFQQTGLVSSAAWFWTGLAFLSCVAVAFIKAEKIQQEVVVSL